MRPNVISAPPEVTREIEQALGELKKNGYHATAKEDPSGDLLIDFTFGATEQTLKFSKDEWPKSGAIQRRIVDKLEI